MTKHDVTRWLLAGFNLNSVLLFAVLALLAGATFRPAPAAPRYEYRALRVSAQELVRALERQNGKLARDKAVLVEREDIEWPVNYQLPGNTEYVGYLCTDGSHSAWVLVRFPKR